MGAVHRGGWVWGLGVLFRQTQGGWNRDLCFATLVVLGPSVRLANGFGPRRSPRIGL